MNAVKSLKEIEKQYENIWNLRCISYPRIFIDVLSTSGKPLLTLYMNLENWNFLAPVVTLLSVDLKRYLGVEQIIENIDPQKPHKHIVTNSIRIWYCSPGFFEYHQSYPKDRWELIKNTDQGTIKWIVENAVMSINREKLGK